MVDPLLLLLLLSPHYIHSKTEGGASPTDTPPTLTKTLPENYENDMEEEEEGIGTT